MGVLDLNFLYTTKNKVGMRIWNKRTGVILFLLISIILLFLIGFMKLNGIDIKAMTSLANLKKIYENKSITIISYHCISNNVTGDKKCI